ncbi:hypothetical protein J6590_030237 [Homalodisca vitripennis]|nr:hypothetical protein J6590_030237 [Homalodisca vitripennis]
MFCPWANLGEKKKTLVLAASDGARGRVEVRERNVNTGGDLGNNMEVSQLSHMRVEVGACAVPRCVVARLRCVCAERTGHGHNAHALHASHTCFDADGPTRYQSCGHCNCKPPRLRLPCHGTL